MRILRVIRGLKSARTVAHFLASKRQESAFLASLLLCLLILVSCSIAILLFEVPAGGNIATAEDAAPPDLEWVGPSRLYHRIAPFNSPSAVPRCRLSPPRPVQIEFRVSIPVVPVLQ